ncbi:glycosyltransferase [Candidatus Berkiella aquae]|uniref:Glycosyltransferase family 2 protein n=1 Tax=Candidatus Berkiella aquae TaxID=295108 RepID=A0A0Q9YQS8_9GAMM|nr:glycosyltransferase family 2 protein [Candidatus Berkiella aquae]MCS5710831.1 glycosyltransferase family 2 protein [Candidatus Berkiella aquae]
MTLNLEHAISIIIPAKNEASALKLFLPVLCEQYAHCEIILVDDGSTDDTYEVAQSLGIKVLRHPYSMGNGAAIKTGARAAKGDILIFMDGDGQHQPSDIKIMLERYQKGYDLIVGARSKQHQASTWRWLGNSLYNAIASWLVGQSVLDLTSGFRVVNAKKFKEFIHLIPNGFSCPTTITMAFFRSGYAVGYIPIEVKQRIGVSHLKPFSDGLKFLLIIYKMAILYSPLKIFIPFAALHFIAGISNYTYTYIAQGRFTNMSAVLLSTSIVIFLIGLVSEQITCLMYAQNRH